MILFSFFVELPENCKYYGPFSIDCKKSLYLNAGCFEEGRLYPGNLRGYGIEEFWDQLTIM